MLGYGKRHHFLRLVDAKQLRIYHRLGDRHGENILLDETNGDTAHVDFNCLFDKGLTFEKPEMVPFRLTHNMVDGFGVSGYEGIPHSSSHIFDELPLLFAHLSSPFSRSIYIVLTISQLQI